MRGRSGRRRCAWILGVQLDALAPEETHDVQLPVGRREVHAGKTLGVRRRRIRARLHQLLHLPVVLRQSLRRGFYWKYMRPALSVDMRRLDAKYTIITADAQEDADDKYCAS